MYGCCWRKLTLITLCLFCGNTDTSLRFGVCTWRGLKLFASSCCLRDVDDDDACDDYNDDHADNDDVDNDDDANNYHDCDVKTGQFRARLLALTLEKLGSFSIDDGDGSENVAFKMN